MIVGAYAFSVLVSAAIAFAFACLVFLLARRPFFARRPRLLALVFAVPFAKVLVEVARGVPKGAFFWEQLRGAWPDSGTFQLGLGFDRYGPVVRFLFGAVSRGVSRSQTAADGLARLLDRRLHFHGSVAIGLLLLCVTCAMVVRELVALGRGSLACRRHARAGRVLETRRLFLRRVDVVLSPTWHGAPFAGGLLRPCVVVSEASWSALDLAEREAVLQHELSHLRWFDGVTLGLARVARSALWFVPGAGAALRRFAEQCEIAADADAIHHGASPEVLASALVHTGETVLREPTPLLALSERSGLVRRVHHLLDGAAPLPFGRWPVVATALVVLAVLRMTTFGH